MSLGTSLISPTHNPGLESALRERLERRRAATGRLGELEPLAVRLGLIQNSVAPRLRDAQLALFAADHGLAIDVDGAPPARSTAGLVRQLLDGRVPVSTFARQQTMELLIVDAGVAEPLQPHPRLMQRRIAHGTRSARVGPAMSLEQAHAAIRAGMEIGGTLPGNAIACAAVGVGADHAAALVIAGLTGTPLRELVASGDERPDELARVLVALQAAQVRHREATDPVEVLAAYGGHDTAMMVGTILVAASKRHLVVVDGLGACAALLAAARIAASVTDYALFARSHGGEGLDRALELFGAGALLELGLHSVDGTGATLAWPLVRAAAALLSEVVDAEERPPGSAAGAA